ncbi:MAG: hypothetical protein P4N59_12450 [Negativicutes bacterium]|nr:hypothetical protein [Negativicutes bacterium]
MSDKNQLRQGTPEKLTTEIEDGEKVATKLDQMLEEFKKKNPAKGNKKFYGGTYQS